MINPASPTCLTCDHRYGTSGDSHQRCCKRTVKKGKTVAALIVVPETPACPSYRVRPSAIPPW